MILSWTGHCQKHTYKYTGLKFFTGDLVFECEHDLENRESRALEGGIQDDVYLVKLLLSFEYERDIYIDDESHV